MQKEEKIFDDLEKELDLISPELREWNEKYFQDHRHRYISDLEIFKRYYQNGEILEIGSLPCHMTYCLKRLGYPVIGVDINPERAADFIEKHPKAVRAYLLAYRDAIDFIRKNPEEAKLYMSKYAPIEEGVAKDVTLPRFNQFGEEDRENIQKFADWMFDNNLLGKKIDVDSMFGDLELIR